MPRKKPKYYDIANLIREYPHAYYYMAIGERSNGKTYSALQYALDRFFKTGEQFAYIRRFGEDIRKKNLSSLFDGHVQNGVIERMSNSQFSLVNYAQSRFYPANIGENEKIESSAQPMGFAFDLNSTEHIKSLSFPNVTTIIFDEFLSRIGYLTNEFVLFMNTLSTIIRDRKNVKIIMIGNTVNKYSPYFQEMGLSHIKDQKPGTTDLYTYGESQLTVVVDYCDPMAKRGGKESDVYFAFDNPQLKMITTGSWEIAIYPHLPFKYKPKEVIANFFVEFDGSLLHGEMVVAHQGYFIFFHPKTGPIKDESFDIVYTNNPTGKWNYRVGIANQSDNLSKTIKKIVSENRVFYSDNETGEVFRNYLMWATQYSSAKGGR